LESFLIPNHLVDGGVVGIAIMGAHLLHLPLGLLLVLLNIPFIYLGYRKLGTSFAATSLLGIGSVGLLTGLVHSWSIITADPVLAAVFGGAAIGLGVGLVIRSGGTLDGAEIVAILIDRKSPFTVGEIIMFMNLFIIGAAGFIFGLDRAMYSLIAYFVAYKVIDITVEGLDASKAAWIVSDAHVPIAEKIKEQLGRKVTYITASGGADRGREGVILSVITRVEELRLKALVRDIDPKAFVVITSAHDVMGKNYTARMPSD
jgi:uncharacterized membrane-anchored protein YitT (DUF2179 family)